MRTIGITGGIASGKSTVARLFRIRNIPVFDADKVARHAYDRADMRFLNHFDNEIISDQGVDRQKLRALIVRYPEVLDLLSQRLHPYVRQAWSDYYKNYQRLRYPVIAAEIPLLLEGGWQDVFDEVWVVHAPEWLRIQRVKRRRTMNSELLRHILARQYSDEQRRRAADVLIDGAHGKASMAQQVCQGWNQWTIGSFYDNASNLF